MKKHTEEATNYWPSSVTHDMTKIFEKKSSTKKSLELENIFLLQML